MCSSDLVRKFVRYGASPRAAQAILLSAKVSALRDGRANVAFDDVLAAAKELSRQQGCSAGQVVSTLMRRALASGGLAAGPVVAAEPPPANGFRPFASRGTPVTNGVIDALRDTEGS